MCCMAIQSDANGMQETLLYNPLYNFIYRWSERRYIIWVCFRKANLPIFWSTWWRWGPEDGFFNSMDRFYGPIGQGPESGRTKKSENVGRRFFPALWSNEIGEFRWNTSLNALYNHKPNGGEAQQQLLIWMCSWICIIWFYHVMVHMMCNER